MKNQCDISLMIVVDVIMSIVDLDLFLVEYAFGADKKLLSLRMCAPDNRRSTVHFHRKMMPFGENIQGSKITSQNGIFDVFNVSQHVSQKEDRRKSLLWCSLHLPTVLSVVLET